MAWLIATKLEMTRVVKWDKFVPVTLLSIENTYVVQIKKQETDWYNALVLGVLDSSEEVSLKEAKKALNKSMFKNITEFVVEEDDLSKYNVWDSLGIDSLEWIEDVSLEGFSKWRWFAWAMKKHNFSWWPKTHGSKFHRALWSVWNRKPRRTHKWKKMHGHYWDVKVSLRWVSLELVNKELWVIWVKWGVPWARNSLVNIIF